MVIAWSSAVEAVSSIAVGASLIGVTTTVTWADAVPPLPSETV